MRNTASLHLRQIVPLAVILQPQYICIEYCRCSCSIAHKLDHRVSCIRQKQPIDGIK